MQRTVFYARLRITFQLSIELGTVAQDQTVAVMAMTKLALLLALAIGGLALCDARPHSGRGLLASTAFSCPGGGEPFEGNNRPGKLPTCGSGSFLCRTPDADCADGVPCDATCTDGTELTLFRRSDGSVSIKKGDEEVDVENGQYKGCNAYCQYPANATQTYVPRREPEGTTCGLSHADFCYTPCKCDKDKVKFYYDGELVEDVSVCPEAALPDSGKYTAVDNCGKTLPVAVADSSKAPADGPCGTITRTLTAPCQDAQAAKAQKITFEDSDISFTTGCPVQGSSKCVAATELTPVVTYMDCMFKAEYKLANACGKENTKAVTCPTCGA